MGEADTLQEAAPKSKWRRIKWLVQGLLVFCLLYYPIGALTLQNIDDNPDFTPGRDQAVRGGSAAVAMAAALVTRETRTHSWVANDPFFLPGALLDDMPNYQQGILAAVATFTSELKDRISRIPGASQPDPGLQEAAGLLHYSGKRWRWDFSSSLGPAASSEEAYTKAVQLLLAYNARVATGNAPFERRADILAAMLDRIALDIDASGAALELHIRNKSGAWIDTDGDDLFYGVKGQAYGYAMILKGLRADYARVIEEKALGNDWARLDGSLKSLTALRPWVVANGRPDGLLVPNHLGAEGFYLLRARTELREIARTLQK